MKKRFVTVLLSLALMLTMMPAAVFAAGSADYGFDVTTAEENALRNLEDKQAAYDEILATKNKGSLGFFESENSTTAANIINGRVAIQDKDKEYYGHEWGKTNVGAEGDATSIENMQAALDLIEQGNQLRASDNNNEGVNKNPLKVSDRMMAISQVQTNASSAYTSHTGFYNVGENLAWGSINPYGLWYTAEKKTYDTGGTGQTGHYLNIANPDDDPNRRYITTGFAINTSEDAIGRTSGQAFNWTTVSGETTYTVAEYKTRLNNYCNAIEQELTAAQNELDAAQAAYDAIIVTDLVVNLTKTKCKVGVTYDGKATVSAKHKDGSTTAIAANDKDLTVTYPTIPGSFTVEEGVVLATGGKITRPVTVKYRGKTVRKNVEITPVVYTATLEQGSTYTRKSGKGPFTVASSADYDKFSNTVLVDGSEINGYESGSGYGTEILLSENYMESLSAGNHTIAILASDGYAKTTFEVAEASEPVRTGWQKIDGEWYYFKSDGQKATNAWAKDSKGWCWMGSDGRIIKSKWIKSGGEWYYLKPNGYMAAKEWAKDSGGWYWMNASGKIAKNVWAKDSGGWYWMNGSGRIAKNAWAKDSKGWCWMGSDGRITKSKWVKYRNDWYYLNASGYMVTGTQKIGGKTYRFDKSGKWIS